MSYITILETSEATKISIIRNIFEDNRIDYQVLDENTNNAMPLGVRIQVKEDQAERARVLLMENGFLQEQTKTENADVPKSRFWTFLFLALVIVIIVGAVIYWLMNPA